LRRYGESTHHEKLKERCAKILSDKGWTVYVDSYSFKCQTAKGERNYTPDVYAESPEYQSGQAANSGGNKTGFRSDGAESPDYETMATVLPGVSRTKSNSVQGSGKRIILEVQGSKGKGDHSTKRRKGKDTNRMEDIRANYGRELSYVPLWDWEIKGFTDQEVWEQIEYLLKTLKG
jgi:hypothetical protein